MTAAAEPQPMVEGRPPSRSRTSRCPSTWGCVSGNDDYLARWRRIQGQVGGLQKMIDADRWYPDVAIQVSPATRTLQEVAVGLLNDHLRYRVMGSARTSAEEGEAGVDEVAATIRQVVWL